MPKSAIPPPKVFTRTIAGRYYDWKSSHAGSSGSAALTALTHFAQLFWVPDGARYDRIGTNVTVAGAAGKLLRLGVYTVGTDGTPGDSLLDSGNLAADAIAAVEATIDFAPPGNRWYYGTILSDGTPTITGYVVTQSQADLGWTALTTTTPEAVYNKTGVAFGALPATFGAISSVGTVPLRVALRAA